jgi:glycosyltransferase involved in cell wall biosynthesis
MRVLHWYPNFLAGGGVANSVLALADAQAAAGAQTWIATLAHDAPIYGPLQPKAGVRITSCAPGRTLRWGRVRLHTLGRGSTAGLRALEPDVVHLHAEFNPDNWWAPRLWTCPLVLSPHGGLHAAVLQRDARAKSLYIALARGLLYRKVARFHVLSPAEQADVAAVMPTARTYCVPQGPSPAVQEALDHLSVPGSEPSGPARLMFIGRIDVEVKGLDLLVEAFARAVQRRDTGPPATLTLVGPDWKNGIRPLRELALRLGIADIVDIRGPVPATEIAGLLQSCDVYVQLSRNESSPLSLNDALALGKPAIVSDRIGTVSSDEIARLPHVKIVAPSVSEAAQAIAETLDDLDGLRRAARDVHAEVRDFLSWERAARRHLEEYAPLVAVPLGPALSPR